MTTQQLTKPRVATLERWQVSLAICLIVGVVWLGRTHTHFVLSRVVVALLSVVIIATLRLLNSAKEGDWANYRPRAK